MPTYEYACTSCGHHLEIVQSFTDAPPEACPSCGGSLRKVFGSIGIVLKGSGFYRTDSRSGSNGKGAAKKTETSPGTGGDTAAAGSSTSSSASGSATSSSSSPSSGSGASGTAAAS